LPRSGSTTSVQVSLGSLVKKPRLMSSARNGGDQHAVGGHGAGYPPGPDPRAGTKFADLAARASGRQHGQEAADARQARRRAAWACFFPGQRKARLPGGGLRARDERRELVHGKPPRPLSGAVPRLITRSICPRQGRSRSPEPVEFPEPRAHEEGIPLTLREPQDRLANTVRELLDRHAFRHEG
jgi:hypothetical protein